MIFLMCTMMRDQRLENTSLIKPVGGHGSELFGPQVDWPSSRQSTIYWTIPTRADTTMYKDKAIHVDARKCIWSLFGGKYSTFIYIQFNVCVVNCTKKRFVFPYIRDIIFVLKMKHLPCTISLQKYSQFHLKVSVNRNLSETNSEQIYLLFFVNKP